MCFKIEVISKEMIKPSSPTPSHLRNLKLSYLDQISSAHYVPLLLFYQHDPQQIIDCAQKSISLKQSLSEALTLYYPLAGRVKDNLSVDCNDHGAEYSEALVHADFNHLSQVIENPNFEELKMYLPIEPCCVSSLTGKEVLLAIRINFFDCGGMVVAVCISHKIADASSLVTFLNAWSYVSRRAPTEIVPPSFDLACYFPPKDNVPGRPPSGDPNQMIETRRFVFSKKAIDFLKSEIVASGSQVKDPTRVEAVSSFIWKHVIDIGKVNNTNKCGAIQAINLRSRTSPPHPETSFGNIYRFVSCMLQTSDGHQDLVNHLRTAIRNINNEYVKSIVKGDNYFNGLQQMREQLKKGELELCNFSSWTRFPMYEADFGWGKPDWVSTTTLPFKNLSILMTTRCGEGIEVWINLLPKDMALLEGNPEFLSIFRDYRIK